jgi:DNA-binding beta-propeller fold protein YncE
MVESIYRISGKVVDRETRLGVEGLRVEAWDKDLIFNDLVGSATTDHEGTFRMKFDASYFSEIFLDRRPDLFFKVFREEEFVKSTEDAVLWNVKKGITEVVIELDIAGEEAPEPIEPVKNLAIVELNKRIGNIFPNTMIQFLHAKDIKTLPDIRRNGGITGLEGWPAVDEKVIKTLEAHAYLSLISDDPEVNQTLIGTGFGGIEDIAESTKASFFREMEKAGIERESASLLHSKAVAASALLTNVLTQARVEQANGLAVEAPFDVEALFPVQCACPDSESAVSPLAYLAELLDYTMKHVQIEREGEPGFGDISLEDLEHRFYQPFGRLPTASAEVERRVRQVRVCIEVLRRYLDPAVNPISPEKQQALTIKEKEYAFEAYKTLLNQIGTSFEELRLIRTAGPERQAALANRLGIDLRDNGSDHLNSLLLAYEEINEQILERLFGLIDTSRDPLCDGIQSEDTDEKFARWNFFGVEWHKNTDEAGNVFGDLRLTNIPSDQGLVYMVNLYRDGERQHRVASGEGTLGTFTLSERNNSGLSARIRIEAEPQNSRFEISVIPRFLAWRLKHLRTLWKEQDWPSDSFTEEHLPVIDPDVIGPEDFRNPEPGQPPSAFGIWEKRRKWIDDELQVFAGLTKIVEDAGGNPLEIPNLEAMFQRMYATVGYQHEEPPVTAWNTSTSTTAFDAILDLLKQGTSDETDAARIRIEQDLNLTSESFVRLMELRDKSLSWERKTSDPPVTKEEWQEVYSILVQAQKRALVWVWCKEEHFLAQNEFGEVLFGPKHFWISLRQPTEGPWSPALHDQRPLIDPEVVKLQDLLADPIGQPARRIWNQRQELLVTVAGNIRRAYEDATDSQLEAALRQALGPPPEAETWLEIIGQVDLNLESLDEETRTAAEQQVHGQFRMSLEDFEHLVTVKSRPEPSQDELDTLFAILTSAHKKKSLHTAWAQEEEDQDLTYWRILKAGLPLWRASLEERVRWQRALRQRSRAPIVDPDLTDEGDFENPHPVDDPAFSIWVERAAWVNSKLSEIRSTREAAGYATWGEQGSADGRFLQPQGIAIDGDGNIYVADTRNHSIQKFNAMGEFTAKWGGYPGSGPGDFQYPSGVAADSRGYIYVADSGNNRIQKFDAEGNYVLEWGDSGSAPGEFDLVAAAAVDREGNVYVVDTRNHRIQKFSENGEFDRQLGEPGNNPGQFLDPLGIAVDHDGNVYVSDTGNHRMQRFDSEGNFRGKWGAHGTAEGQFRTPTAAAIDERGHIHVSDSGNHRVQEFDADGNFIRLRRAPDNAAQPLSDPRGLAVAPSGHLHVTDADIHKIHNFDRTEGLAPIVEGVLGVSLGDLANLAEKRSKGDDITPRLDQLSLPMDAFAYLTRIAELATAGSAVMPSEWEEACSILVQVSKRRMFAEWRKNEKEEDIILCPDFFRVPEEKIELLQWRASREDRRDWEDRLSARTDQEKTVINGMAESVDSCEEATLALLRDAFIMASDTSGNDLETKAKSLTDKLLIDCQTSACRKTTRVSQAITTIQSLIFSLRTGQVEGSQLAFVNDEAFDEEWMWIGSYETWKAAVGVFLYPENILIPNLKRKKTPAFSDLVDQCRKYNIRLSPTKAKGLAKEYEDYYNDVCSLVPQATVQTFQSFPDSSLTPRVYSIARGGLTQSLYISSYDPRDNATAFWKKIDGLDNLDAIDVVGATSHRKNQELIIYLFIKARKNAGSEELFFTRYWVKSDVWDSEPIPLEIPTNATGFSAVVKQAYGDADPPHIAIFAYGAGLGLYARKIDGEGWEDGDWEEDFKLHPWEDIPDQAGKILHAMVEYSFDSYIVISGCTGINKRVGMFKEIKTNQPTEWQFLPVGLWRGSLLWGWGVHRRAYILWEDSNVTWYKEVLKEDRFTRHKFADTDIKNALAHHCYGNSEYYEDAYGSPDNRQIHVFYSQLESELGITDWTCVTVKFRGDGLPDVHALEPEGSALIIPRRYNGEIILDPSYITTSGQAVTETLFRLHLDSKYDMPLSLLEYIKEAFYFLPITIALQLQRSDQHIAALYWFRAVYDYSKPVEERKIYYGLRIEENFEIGYERPEDWLLDPLDVHAIASSRRNTYTRFTLISIIGCLLAYADAEFTRDTVESLAKAIILYETALELLELDLLNQHLDWCEDIIGYLEIEIEYPSWQEVWKRIRHIMTHINSGAVLKDTVDEVRHVMESSKELSIRIAEARQIVHQALNEQIPSTIADMLDARRTIFIALPRMLLEKDAIERGVEKAVVLTENMQKSATAFTGTTLAAAFTANVATLAFCIPPNPMVKALRFHAEINLHKLRTCRNIAGVKREIEVYAAPTDILSAMPAIGSGGQLVVPTRITPPPVPYRYEFLIERSKQLANMAAQMEAAVLSALERKDIEAYNLLQAKQDVRMARAGVKLQNLRLRQAHDEVKLAELQQESAQIQAQTYQKWLEAGLNQWEIRQIDAYHTGAIASVLATHFGAVAQINQAAAAASPSFGAGAGAVAAVSIAAMAQVGASEVAIMARTMAEVASVWATYERRAQEWELQSELAQHAIRIGGQQITIANDGVNIVQQEADIARMQVEQAEDTVEFLRGKFTNVELYDWMSRILEGAYSYFLQQATSMAKIAQNQLAFERQETPPAFIQDDYWEVPSENAIGGATEDSVDRHGLTGSARLMADIYKLDQYRLETEKRKLQLTKSISLACMAPYEFQRFKETGVIVFDTSMAHFDRDFPGHYMRMIKRVRTSVIALIPPTQGIKATLSNIGVSRLVSHRNYLYQTITAHRPPESVALTSPGSATGLFELESQSQMMLPFEGLGVDTVWELRMPKAANQFDYSTLADVIVTLEYTALDSYDYRQQVIDALPSKVSANRPFSFRHQFADPWYDLHNPEQTATPMIVRFRTLREDFPPNIERLKIDHVLLYFAGANDDTGEIQATLSFKPGGQEPSLGGEATAVDGMISTRQSAWPLLQGASVAGDWELDLSGAPEIRALFTDEKIEDILFVITYSGYSPAWPEQQS